MIPDSKQPCLILQYNTVHLETEHPPTPRWCSNNHPLLAASLRPSPSISRLCSASAAGVEVVVVVACPGWCSPAARALEVEDLMSALTSAAGGGGVWSNWGPSVVAMSLPREEFVAILGGGVGVEVGVEVETG